MPEMAARTLRFRLVPRKKQRAIDVLQEAQAFEDLASPIDQHISATEMESRKLSEMRDYLLPKRCCKSRRWRDGDISLHRLQVEQFHQRQRRFGLALFIARDDIHADRPPVVVMQPMAACSLSDKGFSGAPISSVLFSGKQCHIPERNYQVR